VSIRAVTFARCVAAAALVAAALIAAAEAKVARRSVDLDPAIRAIEQALASSTDPGVMVAITDRIRTHKIMVHGFADLKRGIPLTADSRFAVGSISKSFTAVALMQLAQEHRFDPKAPINRYVHSFGMNSKFPDITGRDLLSHTSGLPNYLVDASSSRFVLAKLKEFEPRYAPGAHFWYSNTGFQVLGYALENIEGMPYPEIIQRRIFDRLGMHSSVAVIDDSMRTSLPVSYNRWPYDGSYVESPWFEYAAADGSIVSDAEDLCAYMRFLLNKGKSANGRLLSDETFKLLTTPVLDEYAYGLDVRRVKGDTVIGHAGSIGGFDNLVEAHMNDGFALVFLTNGGMSEDLRQWVSDVVTAAYRGEPLPPAPMPQGLDAAGDRRFAGQYRRTSGGTAGSDSLIFEFIDGQLVLETQGTRVPLRRMGSGVFRDARADDAYPFFFGTSDDAGTPASDVSQGAAWYTSSTFGGKIEPAAPPEYSAYVGHFENNGVEGPVVRVFVRNGRLFIDLGFEDLKPKALQATERPGEFRIAEPEYNPALLRFDTVIEGHALRLEFSGVPLYRKDTP
jgi:D-alanyl-D-alanine carboxypeptidase